MSGTMYISSLAAKTYGNEMVAVGIEGQTRVRPRLPLVVADRVPGLPPSGRGAD